MSAPSRPRAAARLLLGALLALSLCSTTWAADTASQPGAVAYPDNPSGTPATTTGGTAPAPSAKTDCPAAGACADSPPPSAHVDMPKVQGSVDTPATAYPDSPVKTPAADPSGTAPK